MTLTGSRLPKLQIALIFCWFVLCETCFLYNNKKLQTFARVSALEDIVTFFSCAIDSTKHAPSFSFEFLLSFEQQSLEGHPGFIT